MPKDQTPELTGKMRWLFNSARARTVARRVSGRDVTSYPTLGEACGVAHSNFKPPSGVLTDRMAGLLRWLYAFDTITEDGKDCWAEFVVGSLEDFTIAFEKLHPEMRFIAVPIPERTGTIDGTDQRVYVRVDLRRQDHDPTNPTFDAELVCQVFKQIGVRLAVRRGTLKITCRKDLVPSMGARLGGGNVDGGVVQVVRKSGNLTIRPGGEDHMNWEIETTDPPIGVVAADLEGLFKLIGLKEGDEFDVSFLVEDSDLEADNAMAVGGALQVVPDTSADAAIITATGSPLGLAKRQLMAHIAKHSMNLFGDQRPGTAVLCRYAFRIAIDSVGTSK